MKGDKMNDLMIFENAEFGKVRTMNINNEPWFCLLDICKALEIKNISQLKTRLNGDGVIINEVIDNVGRKQNANFVNEANLYKVIFQSRKASANRFIDWVTGEVLPSIRKNGGYIMNQECMTPEEIMAAGLKAAQKIIESKDKEIHRMKPKEIFADAVTSSYSSILIGELAKVLKQNGIEIGQKRLFQWMRDNGYLIKRSGSEHNMPTQRSMELKILEIKELIITNPDGSTKIVKTTKVTGKGQQYFINKFLENK